MRLATTQEYVTPKPNHHGLEPANRGPVVLLMPESTAKLQTREDLGRFTKAMLAMPFIDRINTHLVLTTIEEDFRLL